MGLFRLDVPGRKLRLDKLADRIRSPGTPWDGDFQTAIADAGLSPTAYDVSLGSIGGGNHFCEFQMIDQIIAPDAAASAGLDPASAYLLVHSGSRGFGRAILERHLASGGATLDLESEATACYLAEHDRAVRWARLNRQIIAERAADAARTDFALIADLSHNLMELQPRLEEPDPFFSARSISRNPSNPFKTELSPSAARMKRTRV